MAKLCTPRFLTGEYYPNMDTLYIQLRDEPGADAREVARDIVLDLNWI